MVCDVQAQTQETAELTLKEIVEQFLSARFNLCIQPPDIGVNRNTALEN